MMKIAYIRLMNTVARNIGARKGTPIGLYREWKTFEGMLMECLGRRGYHLILDGPGAGDEEPRTHAAGPETVRIHAHATRRDVHADLYYKQMHLRELFTVDTEGWGADHSALRTPPDFDDVDADTAAGYCRALAAGYLASGESKHPQPPIERRGDLPERFIFVPTQQPQDYVNIHHSPISVPEFIRATAAWARERGIATVFKIHPGSVDDPAVTVPAEACRGAFVHFSDANVHTLIDRSIGVITVNSGVGFESLIHGKPVATLGAADYTAVTHAATAHTLDAAHAFIRDYTDAQRLRAWKFVHHYCFRHAYSIAAEHWWDSQDRLQAYLDSVLGASARRAPHLEAGAARNGTHGS